MQDVRTGREYNRWARHSRRTGGKGEVGMIWADAQATTQKRSRQTHVTTARATPKRLREPDFGLVCGVGSCEGAVHNDTLPRPRGVLQ